MEEKSKKSIIDLIMGVSSDNHDGYESGYASRNDSGNLSEQSHDYASEITGIFHKAKRAALGEAD